MTNIENLPIRPSLRGLKPYGAPQISVKTALNVNENTHRIPEAVALDIVTALAAAVIDLNRYPDREFLSLRQAFADYLGHDLLPENIWAANGSNEVLLHIFQAFGGPSRKALSFSPTYSMYSQIARTTGTDYIESSRLPLYELSPEVIVAAIAEHQPDLVLLCSPNNPTGTPLSLTCIEAAYDATSGVVVIDEAYAEFSTADESACILLPGRERLIVSRTMSKAFAFAGARVGYLAADPAVIDALRLVRLPYHLSALTQAAALAALSHAKNVLDTVLDIRYQRDRMALGLTEMGFTVYRSSANFVLFSGLADAQVAFEELLQKEILVRDVGIPNALRVSAGTEIETTKFLEAASKLSKL